MIEFIEENLIFNKKKECWAFFEMLPYNYSFLSEQQKEVVHESFDAMISGVNTTNIKLLKLATERSLETVAEESKKLVRSTGKLKEIAYKKIDMQVEIFKSENVERQIDYRFFIGFKLSLSKELNIKNILEEIKLTFVDFFHSVNHEMFGEFMMRPKDEVMRYLKSSEFMQKKIANRINVSPLNKDDVGYIIDHINFKSDGLFEDFTYYLPKVEKDGRLMLRKHDLVKLGRVLIEPHERYMKITSDGKVTYVTYLTIEDIKEDIMFGNSELLYFEQSLEFPVDCSVEIEKIPYKKALSTVINKKKEIIDQEEHAYQNGAESDGISARLEETKELEDDLKDNKEAMYKVSYLVRVSGRTKEELDLRTEMLIDFYEDYEIVLVRPYGDMEVFHQEFIPTSGRKRNDYIHQMRSESIASLGFGATTQLGERSGIFIGWNGETGQPVYIRPDMASQGVKGTVTSSPATTFTGSKGGGKSLAFNVINHWIVLFGGKVMEFDPKNERTHWGHNYPFIQDYVNVLNITSDIENQGMFDPFLLVPDEINADGLSINAESLALDLLTFMTGISIKDDEKFVPLRNAVRQVSKMQEPGMLKVIGVLREMNTKEANKIANHIEVFTDYDFARLLFSDGKTKKTLDLTNNLNVIQIADLVLPNQDGDSSDDEDINPIEILSVAIMIAISTSSLSFAQSNKEFFKVLGLEEAWAMTSFSKGRLLINKSVRMGRSLNLGAYFASQQTNDIGDSNIKNNIGMKFAFRSTDSEEIAEILKYFGLDVTDMENHKIIRGLESGECLFQDLYGRIGIVYIDPIFSELFECFDTRPPMANVESR